MGTPLGTLLAFPLALATVVWSVAGNWYARRYLLRGIQDTAVVARQHLEWSRSSHDMLAKKLHLAKARHHTAPLTPRVQQSKEWQRRVYRPVSYGLAYSTVACALWGVASIYL